MSEKEILYYESNFPQEEFLLCDAKAYKNFFGDSIIARSMKLLLDGNKTQKHQVLKNIRYWLGFNNMEHYVPNTLPFLISILVSEEKVSLDAIKTIHKIVDTYRLDLDKETENIIRENVAKYEGDENISKEVNRTLNPLHKMFSFDSAIKVHQQDLLEKENNVRHHLAFRQPLSKKYQFKDTKHTRLENYNGGCVYLIREVEKGRIKIGKSKNVEKRLNYFSVALPFQIEEVHFIATKNYDELERHLHKKFARKRVNGEWFELNENDIEEVMKIKSDNDWLTSEQLTFFE